MINQLPSDQLLSTFYNFHQFEACCSDKNKDFTDDKVKIRIRTCQKRLELDSTDKEKYFRTEKDCRNIEEDENKVVGGNRNAFRLFVDFVRFKSV